jgi:Uma2 family endonuclease
LLIERLTVHLAGATARLRVQLSLQVSADSVLEPDLALIDEPMRFDRLPSSAVLVVEVAISSHAIDRGRKAELYAAAGIPCYWLVDASARTVEVRTDPAPAGYRTLHTFGVDESVPSPCDGVGELSVSALLAGI